MTEETPGSTGEPPVDSGKRESSEERTLYNAIHDILPFKQASQRYLIFSSQRTGSTYLTRRLCNIHGRFGVPSEYLNEKAIQMMSPRLIAGVAEKKRIGLQKYMQVIEQARTTEDGCFGIKVQPSQLLGVVGRQEQALLKFFRPFDRVVLMTRRDKLAQAISGAIAQATGKWFHNGSGVQLDSSQLTLLFPLIAQNLARYIDEERMILKIGAMLTKPVLRIEYEEIEQDGEAAFMKLVGFLTDGAKIALEEEEAMPIPKKPPGDVTKMVRESFLQFIAGDS